MTRFDDRNLADLIRRPLVTEKATLLLESNLYSFEVDPKATKPQIKAAIEMLFDVTVIGVQTAHPPRKQHRVGRFQGYRAHYKKATVRLAEGDSITLFPDV
ncbi:MAG: 50S ribosomal protein L23 [Prochlorotrichaceae cyanobacterium]|jgi:large subunit ribosomal protein L23